MFALLNVFTHRMVVVVMEFGCTPSRPPLVYDFVSRSPGNDTEQGRADTSPHVNDVGVGGLDTTAMAKGK